MHANRLLWILPAISGLCLSGAACAEVTISLPLEGYYRAGRYMPVRMIVHSERGIVRLAARGAVPTEMESTGDIDAIVPWLAVTPSLREPRWIALSSEHPIDLPLRALGDDERLVGLAGEDADIAGSLFAGKKVIPVSLDLSRPLLDPPQAWNCLDGVILSESAAARLSSYQREVLLAGGTLLAVRSTRAPDGHWPWKQQGAYWILRHEPAGPTTLIEPAAYSPTYSWDRGVPGVLRRQVLFAAIVFALLALGLTLWRSRWTVVALVAFCGLSAGLMIWWHGRQSPVLQMAGGVAVDSNVAQVDRWTWQSPLRRAEMRQSAGDLTYPVFASLSQLEQTQLHLRCSADGHLQSFSLLLDPNQSIAFIQRVMQAQASNAPLVPATSPMRDLAQELYVQRGDKIVGEMSGAPPVVVVRRSHTDPN